ncbi:MAG TPA: zinc ribbon domain-containing protein [Thermoanaerobaculia bacterium]|nr:zinc ribbon domain-containing protein [Thermoanaerobaculia bacterium]
MSEAVCTACGHHIDPSAKLCPYCGADPRSGEKVIDTQAMLQEVFRPREVSTSETVIEYARQRQGIVIGVSVVVIFIALTLLHQFVTARNDRTVSAAPAVPLTEITDLSNQAAGEKPLPIPDLDFQYDGRPQKMKTFIVEAGAAAPPEVVAAQQAAQPASPSTPPQPVVGPPRPPAR